MQPNSDWAPLFSAYLISWLDAIQDVIVVHRKVFAAGF
jgi:hypothetical protein